MKIKLVLLFGLALGACVPVEAITPAVSNFNGDSVSIQLNGNQLDFSDAEVKAAALAKADSEASRICAKGSAKRAEFTSTRNVPTGQYTYVVERLYLCLR